MLVLPETIVDAAREAGIKVPPNLDEYPLSEYAHWHVYRGVQLHRRITWGNHWHNAKVIASVPDDKIKKISEAELREMGFDP